MSHHEHEQDHFDKLLLRYIEKLDKEITLQQENNTLELHALNDIRRTNDAIRDFLKQILVALAVKVATGFKISQLNGGSMGVITGITKGAIGNFSSVTVPAGGALQAGAIPVWTTDDSSTSLTPSADGMSVAVATVATDTASSFNLTESGVASDGTAISTTVNVPLLGVAPVPATGFDISQTS